MGCDGGTIPTRDELVRVKKKPEQKDKDSERAFKWKHCAITQEPLRSPIVACEIGRLYNKESIIELLLDRSKFPGAFASDHIKGLKDVKQLQLTDNPAYKVPEGDKGGMYVDHNLAQYICPITGLEMSGKYKFCYLRGCGCVFAKRSLDEIKTETCNKCGSKFFKDDVIILNPTDEEAEVLKAKMEARKLQAKLEKKSKKHKAAESTETNGSSSSSDGASTSKKTKLDTDKPSSSKLTNGASSDASKLTSSKFAIGKDKKSQSVQDDPSASAVYKSLFTTSEKCKNQPKAHWVTYNPQYN